MTTAAALRSLLHKSYIGPAWHGPAVSEILAGVSAAAGGVVPAAGSHCICMP